MARDTRRASRKPSGSFYKRVKGKKSCNLAGTPTMTKLGEVRLKNERAIGGNKKLSVLSTNIANVFNPKTKQYSKAKIKTVVDCPANKNFIRRNVMTKGTIVDTDIGKARITSRPGQAGSVNAVLI